MYLRVRYLFLVFSALLPAVSHAQTLCTNNETVLFSCRLRSNAKVVSLCSSNDLSPNNGYLQYRFGIYRNIELIFPSKQINRPEFTLTRKHDKSRELNSLGFLLGGHSYQLISYRDRSPNGASEEADTIYVSDQKDAANSGRFIFIGECELPLGKPLDLKEVSKKTGLKVKESRF